METPLQPSTLAARRQASSNDSCGETAVTSLGHLFNNEERSCPDSEPGGVVQGRPVTRSAYSCKPCRSAGRILVLTGAFRAGKTTTCRRLVAEAEARGWRVAGVICPAWFQDGAKIGILATDLRSGCTRLLATPRRTSDPNTLGYQFDEDVLAWANDAIASATPCDLLIVDELGPLELEQGRGFVSTFQVLQSGEYRLAVVVVRPSLLEAFASRVDLPFETRLIDGVPYEIPDTVDGSVAWFEEYLRG